MGPPVNRVVILGHSGFVGSQLVRKFGEKSSGVEVVGKSVPEIDLTKAEDVQSLAGLFDSGTAVIICSGIKKQYGDSPEIFSQNVQMVTNLCGLLRTHSVQRLIYFSSAEVYGEDLQNTAITETTPVNPVSFYGIAKYASEGLLRKSLQMHKNGSLLCLRPPLIYGSGDTSKGYGPTKFAWDAANDQEITLWGDGKEKREFLFIEDLAEIVHRLTFEDYGGVVNVATGESYSFADILEILAHLVPHPLHISSRPRTKDQVNQGYSNELLVRLLPNFKFTPLKVGVERTFAAFKEQIAAESGTRNTR